MKHKFTFGDRDTAVVELSLQKLFKLVELANSDLAEDPKVWFTSANERRRVEGQRLVDEFRCLLHDSSPEDYACPGCCSTFVLSGEYHNFECNERQKKTVTHQYCD
jgi:hypothetical protein